MNIIRVIFLMALELTVIYTRETDRVPMTASDLVAAGGQGAAAAVVPPPPPPPRQARRPGQKKTKTHRNKRWRSSSLLRDLPGLAWPRHSRKSPQEGRDCPTDCLAPSGIFNLAAVAILSSFDVLSGDFAIKSYFSRRRGSEPRVKLTRQVRQRGERVLSQRLITLDDQTSDQVGEKGRQANGWRDERSRTPAQVQLPLSMPNDELVLTRRTDQRRIGQRTSRHHFTDCPERLSIASCRSTGVPLFHRLYRREFLYRSEGHHELRPCERLALTPARPEGSGNHSLLSSPSFPFITLTLWPRPRHAFRLCNYAFRHGAVLALPPRSHIVSLSLLSPISALNPPRDHQREKRTIGFGPNHHRAGDIKWTDQRQCHCTLSRSASPPDITTVIKVRALGRGRKGSATWAGNVENWIE